MISLDAVTKSYPDGTIAVKELSIDFAEGELTCLVGPSGCGKTTTMRIINRLVEPTSGRIIIDGEDVTTIDPVQLRRRIGYVIQQVGLFPHLSVAANIATVPKLLGWDRDRTDARVGELLELIGLDQAFGKRYPGELSGGQRQRVGVARALAADPPVLLMDEPFGAVDPLARDRLQEQFITLQRTVRKTIVFVTHDIDEAIKLGDRIAVMRDGGLEQFADPATLVSDPVNEFVADFVGSQRSLRRLRVSTIDRNRLQQWPVISPDASAAETRAAGEGIVVATGSNVTGVITGRLPNGLGAAAAAAAVATVEIDVPLETAMAALLAQTSPDAPGVVVVTDGDSVAGVLTLDALVETARRT